MPTKRPNIDASIADPPEPTHPKLPAGDEAKKSCRGVMKSLVPWVLSNLPAQLAKHKLIPASAPMRSAKPLEIPVPDGADPKAISSYKPAWSPEACHASVAASGLYEAGANVAWIDPEVTGWSLPGDEPSWAWLYTAADDLFRLVDIKGKSRILFPIPLTCFWRRDVAVLSPGQYPDSGGLVPFSGHAFLYAWYVACLKALDAGDMPRCRALYECDDHNADAGRPEGAGV